MLPARLPIHSEQLPLFDAAPASTAAHARAPRRRSRRPRARTATRTLLTIAALGVATAGILAGSYAAWTAQTTNTANSVTAGTLTMSNSKNATSVFSAANVIPGQTGSDTVKVKNTGSVPMTVKLTQDALTTSGIEASLRLSVHDDTSNVCVYPANASGACASRAAWDARSTLTSAVVKHATGTQAWPANAEHTFTIAWELVSSSPNSDQGKTGSFRLVWDALQ